MYLLVKYTPSNIGPPSCSPPAAGPSSLSYRPGTGFLPPLDRRLQRVEIMVGTTTPPLSSRCCCCCRRCCRCHPGCHRRRRHRQHCCHFRCRRCRRRCHHHCCCHCSRCCSRRCVAAVAVAIAVMPPSFPRLVNIVAIAVVAATCRVVPPPPLSLPPFHSISASFPC